MNVVVTYYGFLKNIYIYVLDFHLKNPFAVVFMNFFSLNILELFLSGLGNSLRFFFYN